MGDYEDDEAQVERDYECLFHLSFRDWLPPSSFGVWGGDLLDSKPNKYIPVLIGAVMANFEVKRILVDQGSSTDIMFLDFLTMLEIWEEDLTPYRGAHLLRFNDSKTKPVGYLELMVTYR